MRALVTVKFKAVTPDSQLLLEFLRMYRDWTQYIVNELWRRRDKLPSLSELHKNYYKLLRGKGFRAHHCHKIERRAREIVASLRTKEKNGEKVSKPILRRLTIRIDNYDYKLDINNMVVRLYIHNGQIIKLYLAYNKLIERYRNFKPKEAWVKYENGEFWFILTLEREVYVRKPETVMGIDINLRNISYTILDSKGNIVTIGSIPLRKVNKALHKKRLAEELQKRYPKSWRFIKRVLEKCRRLRRRARNELIDEAHFVSKRLVEIAKEYNACIVLENLKGLRKRVGEESNSKLRWEAGSFIYGRLHAFIKYKALLRGLMTITVSARKTSSVCPKCKGKVIHKNYKLTVCPKCSLTIHRDHLASWNIAQKGLHKLQMWGFRGRWTPECPLNAGMKPQPKRGKPVSKLLPSNRSG